MARRSLLDKRALVTGASSGIGRAIALELAQHRARLVLVARRADRLAEIVQQATAQGASAVAAPGDVTRSEDRSAAVDQAVETFGGLDILVNCAGITAHGRFADAKPERLRQIMEVNFFAAAELVRTALPHLRRGDEPIVVNVGSILGRRGIPHNSEYCASKFALHGLSESLRAELARPGIDVLVVAPGTTDTELFDKAIERHGELPWHGTAASTPERVAQLVVRAMRRGKHEIVPNWRGRMLLWLNRVCPRLVDHIMARYG